MELEELYCALAMGELANLGMADQELGTIRDEKKGQIVAFANEGLTRLYTKYRLSEKSLVLELQEAVTNYHLRADFAVQSFDPDVADFAYIQDLPNNKFLGDVIKVTQVYTSWGDRRPLNDLEAYLSVFTPQNLILQVPVPRLGEVLSVQYQAKHEKLSCEPTGYHIITLPDTLHGALLAFICYKVHMSIGTQEAMAIAQAHLTMFDNICADVTEYDAVNSSISETNTRFSQRGWV